MQQTSENTDEFKITSLANTKKAFTFEGISQTYKGGKRLFKYSLKNEKLFTIGLLVAIIMTSLLPIATTFLESRLIDTLINSISSKTALSSGMLTLILLITLISLLSGLISRLERYCHFNLSERITMVLRKDFFTKLAYLDTEYYDNPKANDLINKVRERYAYAPFGMLRRIFFIIGDAVGVLSSITILASLSPMLVIIALVTAIPESVTNIIFSKKIFAEWDTRQEQMRDAGRTQANLTQEERLKELRIFQLRNYFIKKAINLRWEALLPRIKLNNKHMLLDSVWDIFYAGGYVITLIILISHIQSGIITIGLLTFYIAASRRLNLSVSQLLNRLAQIYEYGLNVSNLFTFMDLKNKVENGTVKVKRTVEPPLIKFNNVSFAYPSTHKDILENFNLEISPGEHIAIVGENGAGKTTLIKLLLRFYDINKGKISINDLDIKNIDVESWYDLVSALFQNYNSYHFDAKTSIGMGDLKKLGDIDKIIKASKKADAHKFIDKYADGYDQVLDKRFSGGINPSTGQKQKIALARVFFRDAPILILDEPTSAIDPKAEYEIFQRLFEFAKGKTVIIISHRFSTVRNANRIIVLDEGKIVEEGKHEELMQIEGGKYRTAFELQRKGYE